MRSLAVLVLLAGVAVAAPKAKVVHVTYDADHLDLDAHKLEFKFAEPAASASMTVLAEDGTVIAEPQAVYAHPKPSDWLLLEWKPRSTARVMMLQLRVVGESGAVTNVELIPWSVAVDHEDIKFAVDSAAIDPAEAAKLDASLAKIIDVQKGAEKFLKLRLYIAGHTDTVGTTAKNAKLSLDRARAIAAYFRTKGLALPIAFAGFGESVLEVKTADNTDEPSNRRVDYVLGPAAGAPPFKGPYLKVKTSWAQLK